MLSLILAATVAMPATPAAGRFRCGIEDTVLTMRRGGGAFLRVGRAQYILRPARAASGSRWVGNAGLEFWEKGDTASFRIGRRAPVACIATGTPQALRALGQEPNWVLDIAADARMARFAWNNGQQSAAEALRPWLVASDGARVYTSANGRLTARFMGGGCRDTMSGQEFVNTVTVTYRGRSYKGCGGPAPMTAGGNVEWIVEDIGGAGLIDASRVTVQIDGDRIAGRSGCNRYSGRIERLNTAVRIGPLAGTRMACAPALMAQETRFLALLGAVTSITTAPDGALILATADGRRIVARRP
jgi:heat shock protein HslJ/uncharacterized membrane protein